MFLSTTKSTLLLNNIVGKSTSVQIGAQDACYLALFKVGASESGTGYTEVSSSGTNYQRKEISGLMNTTYKSHELEETAPTAHTRRIGNASDIVFNQAYNPDDPDATSGADWGTIVAWGLFTVATGGTPYAWGSTTNSVTIQTHDVFLFRNGCFEMYIKDGDASSVAAGSLK